MPRFVFKMAGCPIGEYAYFLKLCVPNPTSSKMKTIWFSLSRELRKSEYFTIYNRNFTFNKVNSL